MLSGLSVAIAVVTEIAAAPPADSVPVDPVSKTCGPQGSEEVVVCGSRKGPSPYRLPKVSEHYKPKKIQPEMELAPGVSLGVGLEGDELPGAQGVGVKVRLRIRF